MNRHCLGILLSLLSVATPGFGQQQITGLVVSSQGEALIGATVQWLGSGEGTITDEAGSFELLLPEETKDRRLRVSYVGFTPDTIEIGSTFRGLWIELESEVTLNEVTVEGRRSGSSIDDRLQKIEIISEVELTRAACCDLTGCFNTESSVRSQTTNIVTNVRELQILGLSGVYNQLLLDGFPMFQGINYTYGLSAIPGPWIRNIYVSKGANSVLQGVESISGQINVETKDPGESDAFFANAYINSFGEKQFNAIAHIPAAEKGSLSGVVAGHVTLPASRIDRDDDDFLDLPLLERYALMSRWTVGNGGERGFSGSLTFRGWKEQRVGGQETFDPDLYQGGVEVFGQTVDVLHGEVSLRSTYRFSKASALTLQSAIQAQDQDAWFGPTLFSANQLFAFANMQYEYQETRWTHKSGLSYRHLDIQQDVSFPNLPQQMPFRFIDAPFFGDERIFGIFTENTFYGPSDKWALITGLRIDHSSYFDWQVSPRALFRYNLATGTSARISIGRGWRTVRPLSDYVQVLASNRDIESDIRMPESAWNTGMNITHRMQAGSSALTLSADYYYTGFSNQIFPDYDTDPNFIFFRDNEGQSVSHSLQLEARATFTSLLEAKIGYNYLNVFREIDGRRERLPFIPDHKVTAALSWQPESRRWQFDGNVHWYGIKRLPDTQSLPESLRQPNTSQAYATLDLQATWRSGQIEVYGGVENLFDFRQLLPLLSWEDPFSPYFDTSFAWGPTRGRELYIGVRYKISRDNN